MPPGRSVCPPSGHFRAGRTGLKLAQLLSPSPSPASKAGADAFLSLSQRRRDARKKQTSAWQQRGDDNIQAMPDLEYDEYRGGPRHHNNLLSIPRNAELYQSTH